MIVYYSYGDTGASNQASGNGNFGGKARRP
jgi:hypothetical protein